MWLSPLQSLYWFFSLPVVARTHLLLPHLYDTTSMWDVTARIEAVRKIMPVRDGGRLPI